MFNATLNLVDHCMNIQQAIKHVPGHQYRGADARGDGTLIGLKPSRADRISTIVVMTARRPGYKMEC